MPASPDWDTLLTLAAETAEGVRLRAPEGEAARVLAGALAWELMRGAWSGTVDGDVQRWREDVPAAMAELAARIAITRVEGLPPP